MSQCWNAVYINVGCKYIILFIKGTKTINLVLQSITFYLNCPGAGPNSPFPCLEAALDGAKPSTF